MKIEFKGQIKEKDYGENCDALFVGDMNEPLAKEISNLIQEHGKFLTVKYWTSNRPLNEIKEAFTYKLLGGLSEAEYEDSYSEITGYLWTDENLKIGGHDFLGELRSHLNQNCILEIEFNHKTN